MTIYKEIENNLKKILKVPFWKNASQEKSAILILPGVYQDFRIPEGAKNWPEKGKYLWVAGTRADPFYTRKEIIEMINKEKGKVMDFSDMENGGYQDHTLDQMMWVTELLKAYKDVNHIVVTTAAYHTPRCVLTLLQTMRKQSIKGVVISPVLIDSSLGPSFESEEFKGEIKRVSIYQEKGDVASFDVWEDYLRWRESQ